MSTSYIVLKHMKVINVNIQPSNVVYGMPSIIGIYGMLHNFERMFNQKMDDPTFYIKVNRFSIIFHDEYCDISSSVSPKMINYMKTENPNEESSITHRPLARMQVSLIVEVISEDDVLLDDVNNVTLNKFCKGDIMHYKTEVIRSVDHNLKLKSGDFLIDTSSDLVKYEDKLQGIITELNSPDSGWNVATHIGYVILESGEKRNGIVGYGEYLHSFSEPLTGIAKLINKRNIDFSNVDEYNSIWWNYSSNNNFIYVRGN